jgi:hypothetical protein
MSKTNNLKRGDLVRVYESRYMISGAFPTRSSVFRFIDENEKRLARYDSNILWFSVSAKQVFVYLDFISEIENCNHVYRDRIRLFDPKSGHVLYVECFKVQNLIDV